MAAVNIDVNAWPAFILRWTFAGLWLTIGWALAAKYVIPNVPFL